MRIALGADHGGYHLKEEIKSLLETMNISYEDLGCCDEKSVDYPDYAFLVTEKVASGDCGQGILVCGTGIGMSIAANKVKGIRCALVSDLFSAKATREHNDSNVLALGARVIGTGLALEIVKVWLTTAFSGGRHMQRLEKINQVEKIYL
ncbi:ribose 5-phosphate isomerase B [Ammoniphilus sp. 3BR4]|uniref:ribose 5-phosphate isomerase B n=1 Tax=Ammoniphilus sp. 3BR4 TaxID=3158265 RepID=UPI003465A5CA